MIIDFTEIPSPRGHSKDRDSFEKFSRDFLENLGFKVLVGPSRGPDGGIDLKVLEKTDKGEILWLVSCKHNAKSKKSVTLNDEPNIRDRVESWDCDGFMGLYSTIAHTSLNLNQERSKNKLPFKIFDNECIESQIVGNPTMDKLFMR
ncbi:MAG: restriction endonuclease, partial [Bacteroidetes bacterium]|nr:restriction endonuclease [Bacteroidota bacterium]